MPELDLSQDSLYIDGQETITIASASPAASQNVSAVKRRLSLRELEVSDGDFVRGDVKFLFPSAGLDFEPLAGHTITDASAKEWDVIFVELLVLGTRYSCWCKAAEGPPP